MLQTQDHIGTESISLWDRVRRLWRTGAEWRFLSAGGVILGHGDDLVTLVAATILPKRIQWLWPERVPLGKLTLFTGDPDRGKSLAAIYVTAVTTTGRNWYGPNGTIPNRIPPGDVLIFADEDDAADTTVPRLMAAGANLNKVMLCKMRRVAKNGTPEQRQFNLKDDLDEIGKHLDQNPNVRLVVLDPVSNYLGGCDMNKEQDVRSVLTPFVQLAERKSVAILGVMHLNKGEDKQAVNRISGAKAFVGVARSVWLFDSDPEEVGASLMLRIKQNIAERKNGLKFKISVTDVDIDREKVPQPFVEWLGESTHSADSLLAARSPKRGRPSEQRDLGKEFLLDCLASGARPATEILDNAKAMDISESTLNRAKNALSVASFKSGGVWMWQLPQRRE